MRWKNLDLFNDADELSGGIFQGSDGEEAGRWSWWAIGPDGVHNASNSGEWHGSKEAACPPAEAFLTATTVKEG